MDIHFVPEQRRPDVNLIGDRRQDLWGGRIAEILRRDYLQLRLCRRGGNRRGSVHLPRSRKPALAIMDIRIDGARDGIDTAIELLSCLGVRSIFALDIC